MKRSSLPKRNFKNSQGFTLVELLVVIAIMAIVVTFSMGAFSSMQSGRTLESAGGLVVDSLNLARQTAMAQGHRVRWEVIDLGAEDGGADYRIYRLLGFQNGDWTPLSRWNRLPQTTRLSPSVTRTSLVGSLAPSVTPSFNYDGTSFSNRNALSITFLPDGTTLLPFENSELHFLTLESISAQADEQGHYPNWFCIVVNPVTGRADVHRP